MTTAFSPIQVMGDEANSPFPLLGSVWNVPIRVIGARVLILLP